MLHLSIEIFLLGFVDGILFRLHVIRKICLTHQRIEFLVRHVDADLIGLIRLGLWSEAAKLPLRAGKREPLRSAHSSVAELLLYGRLAS